MSAPPLPARRVAVALTLLALAAGIALALEALVAAADPAVDLPGRARLGTSVLVAIAVGSLFALAVAMAQALGELRRPRTDDATWPLRVGFEAAVVVGVAVLARLQPFQPAHSHFALALAAAGWATALLVRGAWGTRPMPRLAAVAELALFNVCLFVALGEAALRVAARVHPTPLLAREDRTPREFVLAKRREGPPGHLYFGFPLSSGSHYDEEPPRDGRPLVVNVGDSFSYGVVPHPLHYTTVAERALGRNVPVVNLGLPGAGPLEYLELLRGEGLPLRPAAIVVALFVGNDLMELERAARSTASPLELVLDRERVLLFQLPRRLLLLREEARARPGERPAAPSGVDGVEEARAALPWIADPRLERPTFSADRYVAIEVDRAELACSRETDFAPLHRALAEIREAAGATPLVVSLIPDDFQVDDELWAAVVARSGRADLDRDLPQRRLAGPLAESGVRVLDLLPRFRAECGPRRDATHCYHLRDTHWNARGNRIAGEALAATLAPLLGSAPARP